MYLTNSEDRFQVFKLDNYIIMLFFKHFGNCVEDGPKRKDLKARRFHLVIEVIQMRIIPICSIAAVHMERIV